MARYTGPRARVSRRLGTNIWGTAGETRALDRRPYPPGEHGRTRRRGNVSEYLIQLQEKQKARFDNAVYRAGWAATRPQARQFVGHGHLLVNGKRVNIPSYRLRKGDVVTLREKSRELIVVQHNRDTLGRAVPGWLESGDDGWSVTVRELPVRDQIDVPVREQLIVELYSK